MALDQLSGCLEANDCLEGQETVVILASHHFGVSTFDRRASIALVDR